MANSTLNLDFDPLTKECLITIRISADTVLTHIVEDEVLEQAYRAYFLKKKQASKQGSP